MKRLLLLSLILVSLGLFVSDKPNIVSASAPKAVFTSADAVTESTPDYSTGDLMGGKLTFDSAIDYHANTGVLVSVMISDKSGQVGNCDLVLFDSDPTATTFTENSAFAINAADLPRVIAVVNLGTSNSYTFSANGAKYIGSLVIPVRATAGKIYGALVARATINLASTSDLSVRLYTISD